MLDFIVEYFRIIFYCIIIYHAVSAAADTVDAISKIKSYRGMSIVALVHALFGFIILLAIEWAEQTYPTIMEIEGYGILKNVAWGGTIFAVVLGGVNLIRSFTTLDSSRI